MKGYFSRLKLEVKQVSLRVWFEIFAFLLWEGVMIWASIYGFLHDIGKVELLGLIGAIFGLVVYNHYEINKLKKTGKKRKIKEKNL
jgi:hypothetical protein